MINFVKRSILSTLSLYQRLDKIDPQLYIYYHRKRGTTFCTLSDQVYLVLRWTTFCTLCITGSSVLWLFSSNPKSKTLKNREYCIYNTKSAKERHFLTFCWLKVIVFGDFSLPALTTSPRGTFPSPTKQREGFLSRCVGLKWNEIEGTRPYDDPWPAAKANGNDINSSLIPIQQLKSAWPHS